MVIRSLSTCLIPKFSCSHFPTDTPRTFLQKQIFFYTMSYNYQIYYVAIIVRAIWLVAERARFSCNDWALFCEIKVVIFFKETVSSVFSGFDCMVTFVSVQRTGPQMTSLVRGLIFKKQTKQKIRNAFIMNIRGEVSNFSHMSFYSCYHLILIYFHTFQLRGSTSVETNWAGWRNERTNMTIRRAVLQFTFAFVNI